METTKRLWPSALYRAVGLYVCAACLYLGAVAGAGGAATWQMKQRDMHNTGRADYTVPAGRLNDSFFDVILWQTPLPGPIGSTSLSFFDGAGPDGADILVGTYHWPKGIQAVDRQTGGVFWSGNPDGGETIAKITPAFSHDGATIYVVNDNTPDPPHPAMAMPSTVGPWLIWHNGNDAYPEHLSQHSPTIAPDGRIFLHNWYDRPYAATDDGVDLFETWAAENGDTTCCYSDPALYLNGEDLQVVQAGRSGWLICYDGASGQEKWAADVGYSTDASATIDPDNGNIYVAIGVDSIYVVGLDKDGNNLWSAPEMLVYEYTGESPAQRAQTTGCLSHDGSTYYFQTNNNEGEGCLYAINCADGSVKWSYNTHSQGWENFYSSPIVTENMVIVVGNNDGGVYYAILDNQTEGVLLDTLAVDTGDPDQCHAYASATLSPDGCLYLPVRTLWTVSNGDGDTPDNTARDLFVAFSLQSDELHVGPGQPYATIQAAVDAAGEGDTIVVHENTSEPDYAENVTIATNAVHLTCAEGEDVSIQAAGGPVIRITADEVEVAGFTLTGDAAESAVQLDQADNCRILDNTIANASIGIELIDADGNTVSGNTCSDNGGGIALTDSSTGNSVTGNSTSQNDQFGVHLSSSHDNTVADNDVCDNTGDGLRLDGATGNTVSGNTVTGNGCGIRPSSTSSGNAIYLNLFDNTVNANSTDSTNAWRSPQPLGYRYLGDIFVSSLGNRWSDYTGEDTSPADGVGDSPYPIANDNDDAFPLMAAVNQYEQLLPVINLDTGQDFATVQSAVDAGSTLDGHRIVILPGTYTENANITKQLTLESALGEPNDTILEAADTADHVFEITADNVTVRNLSFRGATGGAAGLYVYDADGCVLENNHCGLDGAGNTYGIYLEEATHARLTHNTCNDNGTYGIYLNYSDDNELSGNTCDQNGFQGFRVQYSNRITASGNTASGSGNCGMYLSGGAGCAVDRNRFLNNSGAGVYVMNTDQTVLTNNIANNNTGGGMCLSGFVSSPNTNAQVRDNTADNNRLSYGIYAKYLTGSTISGNTCRDNDKAGLHLESGSGNTISDNTFERNQNGIYMKYLNTSTISDNTLNENGSHSEQAGIYLDRDCTENLFSNNTLARNTTGFYSYQSYTNTLTGNTLTQNDYNLGFASGSYINGFLHTIDTSNTVDGKPVYYLVDKHHQTIPADAGFVGLVNCSHIVVKDLSLSHNIQSVLLSYATDCLVYNVTVTDNILGIHLQNSVDNTIACCTGTGNTNGLYVYWVSSRNSIYGNNFSQNTNAGVLLEQSSYENILYANTLHENTYGLYLRSRVENSQILANSFAQNNYSVYFYSVSRDNVLYLNDFNSCAYGHVLYTSAGPNTWSSPDPLSYRYNGSAYTNYLGNHWNNYGGSDGNGDGIGDSAHTVYGSETDPYPLIAGSSAYRTGVEVTAALTGGGRPVPDGWELPLTVAIHSPGADVREDDPLWTFVCLTRRVGGDRVRVQIPPIPSSTYDITARANHTLKNVRRSAACLSPAASVDLGTLVEGNADNNHAIDLFDFGRLSAGWLDTQANPDFDHDADFNRDGEIDLLDLDMLTANWLAFGPVELP